MARVRKCDVAVATNWERRGLVLMCWAGTSEQSVTTSDDQTCMAYGATSERVCTVVHSSPPPSFFSERDQSTSDAVQYFMPKSKAMGSNFRGPLTTKQSLRRLCRAICDHPEKSIRRHSRGLARDLRSVRGRLKYSSLWCSLQQVLCVCPRFNVR